MSLPAQQQKQQHSSSSSSSSSRRSSRSRNQAGSTLRQPPLCCRMDAFEDPFEGVDPAALAAMEAAAVKAAAVDEDKYIANDPRAQERAREASAMLQASLEADRTGKRV